MSVVVDASVIVHWLIPGIFTESAAKLLAGEERFMAPDLLIAADLGRSVYDSLYLALALAADAPFVTADRKLRNAIAGTPVGEHVVWIEDWTESVRSRGGVGVEDHRQESGSTVSSSSATIASISATLSA